MEGYRMANLFSKIKAGLGLGSEPNVFEEAEKDYVEVGNKGEEKPQLLVRTFVLEDFSDIKIVLDVLRDGYTIPIINIKPIKEKDLIELKRAINKLKKTTDAIGGDIAGVGDDYIVCTPAVAKIYRAKPAKKAPTAEDLPEGDEEI
jgi:SepF-like predicted cell division protein (DUF552 family)